ncbi:Helicase SKI2W [Bulinus truncatus]|nr:Helicase SKI2W [Bulinus truncatus]
MELAEWVGKLKKRPVYVITTSERPVPLIHYLYTGYPTSSSDGLYLFFNEKGQFSKDGFNQAEQSLEMNPLKEKSKDRETILTSKSEQKEIKSFFKKCISKLSKGDQILPQVQQFRHLLPRGFGVHHSGILPILKEMVEILFQKSLIKILFATETFAMGVNMPAKTVIFDDVIKHDGKSFRPLHTGEYVQMSGRAGRRGMDTVGSIVILCKIETPNQQELHRMVLGKPTNLESRFRLSYLMILQLLRVEQLQVQDMMKRSFSTFTDKKEASEMLEQIKSQLSNLTKLDCFLCNLDIEAYYNSCNEYYRLLEYIQKSIVNHPSNVMVPGRIIVVRDSKGQAVFGVVLEKYSSKQNEEIFVTCVLLDTEEHDPLLGIHPVQFPCPQIHLSEKSEIRVIEITTKDIIRVTKSISSTDISKVIKAMKDKKKQLNQSHRIEVEENFRALRLLYCAFEDKFDCKKCPKFLQHFYAHDRNVNITRKHKELQHLLSDEHLSLLPEYVQMNKIEFRDMVCIKSFKLNIYFILFTGVFSKNNFKIQLLLESRNNDDDFFLDG